MTITAILLAGGSGLRAGNTQRPKPFERVAGRMMYEYSLERFAKLSRKPDEIIFVLPEQRFDEISAKLAQEWKSSLALSIPLRLIAGGSRRQDSVFKALLAQNPASLATVIHDAARPFFPLDTLDAMLTLALDKKMASLPALQITDTLKFWPEKTGPKTMDRKNYYRAQTPQVFPSEQILKAYSEIFAKNKEITDDSQALELCGIPCEILQGSLHNIKVTFPEDFTLAGAIAELKP